MTLDRAPFSHTVHVKKSEDNSSQDECWLPTMTTLCLMWTITTAVAAHRSMNGLWSGQLLLTGQKGQRRAADDVEQSPQKQHITFAGLVKLLCLTWHTIPKLKQQAGAEKNDFRVTRVTPAKTTVRQGWWSQKPTFKSKKKTIAASLHQLDVESAAALLRDSSSPKPTRSSKVNTQTMHEVIDLSSKTTFTRFFQAFSLSFKRHRTAGFSSSFHLAHWLS